MFTIASESEDEDCFPSLLDGFVASESEDEGGFPSLLDGFDDSDDDDSSDNPTPMSSDDSPKNSSSDPPTDESEDEIDEQEQARIMAQRRRASRPFMSRLQKRRMSLLGNKNVGGGLQFDALTDLQRRHSTALSIQNNNLRRNVSMGSFTSPQYSVSPPDFMHSPAKKRWLKALRLIREMKDPWARFHLEDYPEETVIRHRYNPLLKKWVKDEIKVKLENEVSLSKVLSPFSLYNCSILHSATLAKENQYNTMSPEAY